MNQLQFLLDYIEVVVLAAFFVSLFLPILTLPFWRWYRDSFGVNLNLKDFAIALALLASFLHYLFGVDPMDLWFKYVQSVAITAIPIILIWRFFIIIKEQRLGLKEQKEQEDQK
jgi:hypothetical protein